MQGPIWTRDGGPNAVCLNGDDALGLGDREWMRERRAPGRGVAVEDRVLAEFGVMDAQDAILIVMCALIMTMIESNVGRDMLALDCCALTEKKVMFSVNLCLTNFKQDLSEVRPVHSYIWRVHIQDCN